MKDRRTTRFRSDLKPGDLVTRIKGWFVPAKLQPNNTVWGMYDEDKGLVSDNMVYFSDGSDKINSWDMGASYIDLAPKGNFITRYFKRLKAVKQLKKLLDV